MPRHRIHPKRRVYLVPDDFPKRLELLKEESGLPWAEIARRLGVDPLTVRRWWKYGVRPNPRHMAALLDLANSLGLGHILTAWSLQDGSAGSSEKVMKPGASNRCRSVEGKARRSAKRVQAGA